MHKQDMRGISQCPFYALRKLPYQSSGEKIEYLRQNDEVEPARRPFVRRLHGCKGDITMGGASQPSLFQRAFGGVYRDKTLTSWREHARENADRTPHLEPACIAIHWQGVQGRLVFVPLVIARCQFPWIRISSVEIAEVVRTHGLASHGQSPQCSLSRNSS